MLMMSKSRIRLFEQCRRKYKFKYLDKIPEPESLPAQKGTEIHQMMEDYYKHLKKKTITGMSINESLVDSGLSEHPKILTSVFKFENLRYDRHVIEKRLKDFIPIHTEIKIVDSKLGLIGLIDRVDKNGDDIIIIDYKTGRPYKDISNYRFELAVYKILFESKFPCEKVTHWGIWFLKNGTVLFEKVKKVSVTAALKKIERVRERIETEKKWDRNISVLCDYCGYRNICLGGER